MAKSLVAQIYRVYKQKKKAREAAQRRAEKEFEKEQNRLTREMMAEEKRCLREEEQLAKEQARQAEQKERERLKREAQAKREADQALREEARRTVQAERDLKQRQSQQERYHARLTSEQRRAEAEAKTTAIRIRVEKLDRLLVERTRELKMHSVQAEDVFNSHGASTFVDAIHTALATSIYPEGFHGGSRIAFYPESRELLVDYELPRQDVIPDVAGYRYIQRTDQLQPDPRKDSDIKRLYRNLIARVTLRTLAEVFDVTPVALVDSVVFNGRVSAKDKATGKPIRPCLISVNATRKLVSDLVLDESELDPVLCLRQHLNAIISKHPYDLDPVRPVVEFDLSKYKFVEEMDVVASLDSRPDLLALNSVEFEHLVRRLFEEVGMKSWVTQASRDEGVDGVAVNEDPLVGGLCVIQAKRYKNVVGVEAVHALAGVMNDKAATKGILVTTSWFGKASRDFVARNGRMELIDGRNLKAMLQQHLGLDVLIGLPKLPQGWEPKDVT
ncbi:MAG: restriction endonuclease [Pseudonocardiaceae bacterium]